MMASTEGEYRSQMNKEIKTKMYDKHGIYNNKLKSSDFYPPEPCLTSERIINEIFYNLVKREDVKIAELEDIFLEILEELNNEHELTREISVNAFRAIYGDHVDKGFKLLSNKYEELIEVEDNKYLIIRGLKSFTNDPNIKWFFNDWNTCFGKFLKASKKVMISDSLFVIPLFRNIQRGKNKGLYYYYTLIDNQLGTITIYEVNNLRYLHNKSKLHILLRNMYPNKVSKTMINYLTNKAPKIASENLDMMKDVYKGKMGNFYRDKKLIKQ